MFRITEDWKNSVRITNKMIMDQLNDLKNDHVAIKEVLAHIYKQLVELHSKFDKASSDSEQALDLMSEDSLLGNIMTSLKNAVTEETVEENP